LRSFSRLPRTKFPKKTASSRTTPSRLKINGSAKTECLKTINSLMSDKISLNLAIFSLILGAIVAKKSNNKSKFAII